jgi:hypothetical protein
MVMKCPKCKTPLNVGKLLRQGKMTEAQKAAARANGKLGGRPRKQTVKGKAE